MNKETITKWVGVLVAIAGSLGFTQYKTSGLSQGQKLDLAILQAQVDTVGEILEDELKIKVRVDPAVIRATMEKYQEVSGVYLVPEVLAQEDPPDEEGEDFQDWVSDVENEPPPPTRKSQDPNRLFRKRVKEQIRLMDQEEDGLW